MAAPHEGKGHDGGVNRYRSPLVCTTDTTGCICTCLTTPAELNEAFPNLEARDNQAKPRLKTNACGNWNTTELTAAITAKYIEESWK